MTGAERVAAILKEHWLGRDGMCRGNGCFSPTWEGVTLYAGSDHVDHQMALIAADARTAIVELPEGVSANPHRTHFDGVDRTSSWTIRWPDMPTAGTPAVARRFAAALLAAAGGGL